MQYPLRLCLIILLIPLASACTAFGKKTAFVNEQIAANQPEAALKQLSRSDFDDDVLYYLEKGTLESLAGKYEQSNQTLELAKDKMNEYYTRSVSKAAGSMLTNDAVTDYAGDEFEQVHVHVLQLLNYMKSGNPENAAVIARQLDSKLSALKEAKQDEGERTYQCDPYANYLAGIATEASGERSNARIFYQRAVRCYEESQVFTHPVPQGLKVSLLRALKHDGLEQAFQERQRQWQIDPSLLQPLARDEGELIIVLDEGFIAPKIEKAIRARAPSNKIGISMLKIAIPDLNDRQNIHHLKRVSVHANGHRAEADYTIDLDKVARATLNDQMPGITARAIARAFVKKKTEKEAEKRGGGLARFSTQLINIATEVADTRSWRSLPHSIWVARMTLPSGRHDVRLDLMGRGGGKFAQRNLKAIEVRPGETRLVHLRWANRMHLTAKR